VAKQRTDASLAWTTKGKVTGRERFLAKIEAGLPWRMRLALVEPQYARAGRDRPPARPH